MNDSLAFATIEDLSAGLHAGDIGALELIGLFAARIERYGELSKAFIALTDEFRPDSKKWPKLYVFHCPMAKAEWVQPTKTVANPYYGFKMRDCGELKAEK